MTKEKETKVEEKEAKDNVTEIKEEKGVFVEVAGKKRKVRFPVSSLIKLKKEMGITMGDLQDEEKLQDIETILGLIWAGLIADSPDLTPDFLADNMELYEINEVSAKVSSVINKEGKKE